MKGEAADIAVEFGEHGTIFITRAAQPPHLAASGDTDGAVGRLGHGVGAGEGIADRGRLVEALVRAERAVHGRNGVRIAISEQDLLEVTPQKCEKAH